MSWQEDAGNGNVETVGDVHALIDEDTGARPLHYAAKGGQLAAVSYLIEIERVSIDPPDRFGRTALYLAILYRHLDVARFLLNAQASPDATCQCGTTCVSKAAENGDIEILKLLLERGASWRTQNQDQESPRDLAMRNGHLLAWKRFQICERDRLQKFLKAAKKGQIEDMKDLILRGGVDCGARGSTGSSALDLAVQHGQIEAVKFLLYDDTISPVPTAQRVQIMDARQRTALHWAAINGNAAIVELLLAAGASPNVRDNFGMRPVDRVTRGDRERVLEMLRQFQEL